MNDIVPIIITAKDFWSVIWSILYLLVLQYTFIASMFDSKRGFEMPFIYHERKINQRKVYSS